MGKLKQNSLEFICDALSEFFEAERTDPDHPNKITALSLKNLDQESPHLSKPLQQLLCKIDKLFPVNSHNSLKSPSHTASKVMELLETFFKSNTDAELPKKLKNLIELRAELPKSRSEIMLLPPEKIRQLSQNLCVIFDENFDENQQLSPDIFLKNLKKYLNNRTAIAMFVPTPQKESESEILQILNDLILRLSGIKVENKINNDMVDTSHYSTIIEDIIKISHHPVFNNLAIKERTPNILEIIKSARKHSGKQGRTRAVTEELLKRYHDIIDTVKEGERSGELEQLNLIIDTEKFASAAFDGENIEFKNQQPLGRRVLRRASSASPVGRMSPDR